MMASQVATPSMAPSISAKPILQNWHSTEDGSVPVFTLDFASKGGGGLATGGADNKVRISHAWFQHCGIPCPEAHVT